MLRSTLFKQAQRATSIKQAHLCARALSATTSYTTSDETGLSLEDYLDIANNTTRSTSRPTSHGNTASSIHRRGLHSNTIDQSYATSEETGLSFEEYLEIANTDQNAHAGPVKNATVRSSRSAART